MNATIVADGRGRLREALREKIKLRRAELSRECEERHKAELARAGFLRRLFLHWRIHQEIASILRLEFPSHHTLFIR